MRKSGWVMCLMLLSAAPAAPLAAPEPAARVNIALGKPYTFSPRPNYRYCTDAGDAVQLTDGVYSKDSFWVQKSTVGWANQSTQPMISIDLGKVEPIGGVSFSTAAGAAGVKWPRGILIFVSDDGKRFCYQGELISLSWPNGQPKPDEYSTHRYVTRGLATRGRHVRLLVQPDGHHSYLFCDEVEVYRGPERLLARPAGGRPFDDFEVARRMTLTDLQVRRRLRAEVARIRAKAAAFEAGAAARRAAERELDRVATAIERMALVDDPNFRAVAPLNDLHRRILRVNAALLCARGARGLVVWHKNRYDRLAPDEWPREFAAVPPRLVVAMMSNEHRAEVLNLTNATGRAMTVRARIEGLPGGPNPTYATVREVQAVDAALNKGNMIVSAALPEAKRTGGGFELHVPSGMTRQVWLGFHPRKVPAGTHEGAVVLSAGGAAKIRIPLTLRVAPLRFPDRPTCSLWMWDYTDREKMYGITPANRAAAIANMRSHYLDSPWATSSVRPTPAGVDKEGNFAREMDYRRFDEWVSRWKGARNYFVFLNVRDEFIGTRAGTPQFARLIGQWAAAWARHNKAMGLKPRQVGVLLVDEPGRKEQFNRIAAWAEAIRAGTREIAVFEDPSDKEPWRAMVQKALSPCDWLCVGRHPWYAGSDRMRKTYLAFRDRGAKLAFYTCAGPTLVLDPYYYHRLQAWHCWRWGATGMGFWCYGGTSNSWNQYPTVGRQYAPVFMDKDSITDGKHWEAVREGIEDYEYLRMLRDRIAELRGRKVAAAELAEAEKLLKALPEQVAPTFSHKEHYWTTPRDRSRADKAGVRILDMLVRLGRSGG